MTGFSSIFSSTKRLLLLAAVAVGLLVLGQAAATAAEKVVKFPNEKQEKQYHRLLENLRCLKCANQSLADSQAGLAQDLRYQVFLQVNQGKQDKDIIDYLVTRYGDYVLYDPRLNWGTLLLYISPVLILLLAFFTLFRFITRNQQANTLSASDLERVDEILAESDKTTTKGR